MNNPCATCAFGKEGAANEPRNKLKGDICAFGATPFFCHHGRDGLEYDWQESKLGPLQLERSNRKLCAGWQAKVAELKRRGYFVDRDMLIIRRAVARWAFDALGNFTRKNLSLHKKQKLSKRLERCVRFIVAKDISNLEIPL